MSDGSGIMPETIKFSLDGREVDALPGETIWRAAFRHQTELPHLCFSTTPGYRPDGNCRACMVEIEGERSLAASCVRMPAAGMKVASASERAVANRKLVFELLVADQPPRATAHDPGSEFWRNAERVGVTTSRFAARRQPTPDRSHPAMAVQLDACIQCTLCVRACREVQVNDVIGMALRGPDAKIVFDFDDPMGDSTCVGCGECVQACPTGALLPATMVDAHGASPAQARPRGRQRLPLLRRRLPAHLPDQKRQDRRRRGPRRPRQRKPDVRQGPLRLRLYQPSGPADGAADAQGRRPETRR